jgi:hypothetical protein
MMKLYVHRKFVIISCMLSGLVCVDKDFKHDEDTVELFDCSRLYLV